MPALLENKCVTKEDVYVINKGEKIIPIAELTVKRKLELVLEQFSDLIEVEKFLEIDCVVVEDGVEGFKIVNHELQDAFFVPIKQIVTYPPGVLIEALKTGQFIKLEGVTRIVGYYSRVSNWNKSKIGELRDRRIGNYDIEKSGSKLRKPESLEMV